METQSFDEEILDRVPTTRTTARWTATCIETVIRDAIERASPDVAGSNFLSKSQNSAAIPRHHAHVRYQLAVSPHPRDRDLESDLAEQLQFLTSSASSFDQGQLSESKRVALVIRVLVHDTGNSHSLLAQLNIKDGLAWADSAPVIDRDPNTVARSPGLTTMGMGANGMIFRARYSEQIEQSTTTRYVPFVDWWERPVIVDANGAEFSRRDLVLALANKDGGAHIDRLNEAIHAFVHSNSAGFVSTSVPVIPGMPTESIPIPTPIYASVRTIAEELLLTLRRSGRQVPQSTVNPEMGSIDMFVAGDYVGKPLVLDKFRDDVSHASFKFDTLPGVTFEIARLQSAQSDPAFDGGFPAGWLDIVGVRDTSGAVVHQSGSAGPTEATTAPPGVPGNVPRSTAHAPVTFGFENFS